METVFEFTKRRNPQSSRIIIQRIQETKQQQKNYNLGKKTRIQE